MGSTNASALARVTVAACIAFALFAASVRPALAEAPLGPTPIVPTHLAIPRIGVDSTLDDVGLTDDGSVQSPPEWMVPAWYRRGYEPGADGNAAIIGHLDSTTGPAVFWHLLWLRPGDRVLVDDGTTTLTFVVHAVAAYAFDRSPMGRVYGPSDVPHLNLVTCAGTWSPFAHNYSDRLVVYTVLEGS